MKIAILVALLWCVAAVLAAVAVTALLRKVSLDAPEEESVVSDERRPTEVAS